MADHYHAIVIGTGFGGAVTACRLAQAGLHTLVLERGRRYDLATLPDLPNLARFFRVDGCGPTVRVYGTSGTFDGVAVAQSADTVAGRSSTPTCICGRRATCSTTCGPADCRDRHCIDRYYDLAGYMLDIAPVPNAWRGIGKVRSGLMAEAFRDTARGLPIGGTRPDASAGACRRWERLFSAARDQVSDGTEPDDPDPPAPLPERTLPLNRYGRHQGECERCWRMRHRVPLRRQEHPRSELPRRCGGLR